MSPSPDTVRLMLVERRDTVAVAARDPRASKVRRYRLARVALDPRGGARGRFDHLSRCYD